jgi:hypothetical protein
MEVIEIDDYFINRDNNVISVSFRMIGDPENMIREDIIEYSYLDEFGYNIEDYSQDFDVFDEEWDEWDDEEDYNEVHMDEDELRSFLNEYYVVFPDKIPDAEHI